MRQNSLFQCASRIGLLGCLALTAALAGPRVTAAAPSEQPLRVCSDPNNLPFSNKAGEGFENELARFLAARLGASGVEYAWRPQRRGFVRNTLNAGQCDLIMGVPAGYELAEPTRPYYRSTYVFVFRKDAPFEIDNLNDPLLRELKVGVHMVGDDYSSTPGATAMGRRGIINNLVGYSVYGDYSKPHPPSRLIEAVAAGEIDVAIAWGPLAGYFASRQDRPLRIVPVAPRVDGDLPFTFAIAMATRPGDHAFRARLEQVIESEGPEIRALLERYGVPLLPTSTGLQSKGPRPLETKEPEEPKERVQ